MSALTHSIHAQLHELREMPEMGCMNCAHAPQSLGHVRVGPHTYLAHTLHKLVGPACLQALFCAQGLPTCL